MFGLWADDKATGEGRGPDSRAYFRFGRKTLRIHLDECLALLRLVKGASKLGNEAGGDGSAAPEGTSPFIWNTE